MIKSDNTRRTVSEDADHPIVLSDGTRLSERLWRPEDAHSDPVPLLLEFLPYRKRDGTCARDALPPYIAARDYACARVDMRGNGDSERLMKDEYTAQNSKMPSK